MRLSFSYPYRRGMPTRELIEHLEDTALLHDFQFPRSRVTWSDAWTDRDGSEWITATVDVHPRTEPPPPPPPRPRGSAGWVRQIHSEAERILDRINAA